MEEGASEPILPTFFERSGDHQQWFKGLQRHLDVDSSNCSS